MLLVQSLELLCAKQNPLLPLSETRSIAEDLIAQLKTLEDPKLEQTAEARRKELEAFCLSLSSVALDENQPIVDLHLKRADGCILAAEGARELGFKLVVETVAPFRELGLAVEATVAESIAIDIITESGDPDAAYELAVHLVEALKDDQSFTVRAFASYGRAVACFTLARYAEILESLSPLLEEAELLGNHYLALRFRQIIGATYATTCQWDQAERKLADTLVDARKVADQMAECRALHNLGIVYHRQGKHEAAAPAFHRSAELSFSDKVHWKTRCFGYLSDMLSGDYTSAKAALALAENHDWHELPDTERHLQLHLLIHLFGSPKSRCFDPQRSRKHRDEGFALLQEYDEEELWVNRASDFYRSAYLLAKARGEMSDALELLEKASSLSCRDLEIRSERRFRHELLTAELKETQRRAEEEACRAEELASLNQEIKTQKADLEIKNAQLKRLDELKNETMGILAHDLRGPLGTIVNYSEFILDHETISPKVRNAIGHMHGTAEHLIKLSAELLDVIDLENSRETPVDLNCLSDAILTGVHSAQAVAAERQVTMKTKLPSQSVYVRMDCAHIKRIVDNLTSNAIKYTQRGSSVLLELEVAESEARLKVTDCGEGVPLSERHQLFKMFGKTSVRAAPEDGGSTGLGLYIVRKLLESINGRVSYEDASGGGSTFTATWPIS